jgi:hypothetical protein
MQRGCVPRADGGGCRWDFFPKFLVERNLGSMDRYVVDEIAYSYRVQRLDSVVVPCANVFYVFNLTISRPSLLLACCLLETELLKI